ncbi:MAG: hypothetical protein LBH03_07575 [Holophagales bacterium]|nr:hypothetical protein [Holophagales bacterium]
MPSFVDGSAFGGTKLFSEGLIPTGNAVYQIPSHKFFALGFARGDQGADKFIANLDNVSSSDSNKISKAILELEESPWGLRSRAYGLVSHNQGTTISFTREEMTSLWANVLGSETVGFDVNRSVMDRFSITWSSQGRFYYGSTLRIERWSLGSTYKELGIFSQSANLSQAKNLLDYSETQNSSLTYALDAFTGIEIADSVRLAIQANRLKTRDLGDVKEVPQFRGGAQIDLGTTVQLTLESDINEAMRIPFPVKQKTSAVSLKVKANTLITFAIGAEKKTMNGQQTTKMGLNAWITGKKHNFGAGFQYGQDTTPMGFTWKIQ